jgi:uncharacterized membrane protein YfcA
MGVGGSFKYAMHGLVDIRLAMIILGGSLFGIQLGAMGTTYVKPFVIKLVMGVIMVIVLFSRGLMVPVYLSQLGLIQTLGETTVKVLKTTSFAIMIFALATGAFIVMRAMWIGRREERLAASQVLEHGKV